MVKSSVIIEWYCSELCYFSRLKLDISGTQSPKCLRQKGFQTSSFVYILLSLSFILQLHFIFHISPIAYWTSITLIYDTINPHHYSIFCYLFRKYKDSNWSWSIFNFQLHKKSALLLPKLVFWMPNIWNQKVVF